MKTRFRTVFLLIAGLLSVPLAQESPFNSFIIALWPEYDRPGVLVILTGEIESDRLPLRIRTPMPGNADVVMAMGQEGGGADLSPVQISREETGMWIDTLFVEPQFQIEFYFDPFDGDDKRKGEYLFQINHPLNTYHVAVQVPLGSEEFVFSESEVDSIQDEHGLQYIRKRFVGLSAYSPKPFSFSYTNKSGGLTVNILQQMLDVMPTQELQTESQTEALNRYRLPTYEPYLILGVVVILIGAVFWRSEKRRGSLLEKYGKNFCSNCSSRIDGSGNFCSNCGMKLT
ncbi:MAG: hypothetical protein VX822_02390 [Candidatus Neomarinimicrobiota bacterium]|nr:hypothetical protein [Candidatus Neomarinimicrobiota bacterium]